MSAIGAAGSQFATVPAGVTRVAVAPATTTTAPPTTTSTVAPTTTTLAPTTTTPPTTAAALKPTTTSTTDRSERRRARPVVADACSITITYPAENYVQLRVAAPSLPNTALDVLMSYFDDAEQLRVIGRDARTDATGNTEVVTFTDLEGLDRVYSFSVFDPRNVGQRLCARFARNADGTRVAD